MHYCWSQSSDCMNNPKSDGWNVVYIQKYACTPSNGIYNYVYLYICTIGYHSVNSSSRGEGTRQRLAPTYPDYIFYTGY